MRASSLRKLNRLFGLAQAIAVVALVAALTRSAAAAPVEEAFTYQGVLNLDGGPFNGAADLRFELYAAGTGGSPIGSAIAQLNVTIAEGLVLANLNFGPGLFDGDARWVQVSVRTPPWNGVGAEPPFTVLLPRQSLTPTPYAIHALSSDDSYWVASGSNIYYDVGSVGIGRNPSYVLDIGGAAASSDRFSVDLSVPNVIRFGNLANDNDTAALASAGNVDIILDSDNDNAGNNIMRVLSNGPSGTGTELFAVATDGSAAFNLSDIYLQAATGNVGLGTTSPGFPLTFASTLGDKISLFGQSGNHYGFGVQSSALQIHANNSNSDIVFGYGQSSALTELMRIQGNGRIAMGTDSPGNNTLQVDAQTRPTGVRVDSSVAGGVGIVVNATGTTGNSVAGDFSTDSNAGTALYAEATSTSGVTYGVRGKTESTAAGAAGVRGEAPASGNTNYGVYGQATGATAYGVYANGRLGASGTKAFMIDHPLDPENKVLMHYSAESPQVLNIYSGNITLDARGEAWVSLPDYFDSINVDPRYQLTPIGAPAPQLHIAQRVQNNRFKIAGGASGMEVSWEIKAQRNDRFVAERGAPVEQLKSAAERGRYIDPSLYGKPEEMGIFHVVPHARPGDDAE